MTNTGDLWEGNVNEAVVEEWKDETTPFERTREIHREEMRAIRDRHRELEAELKEISLSLPETIEH